MTPGTVSPFSLRHPAQLSTRHTVTEAPEISESFFSDCFYLVSYAKPFSYLLILVCTLPWAEKVFNRETQTVLHKG